MSEGGGRGVMKGGIKVAGGDQLRFRCGIRGCGWDSR